MKDKSNFLRFLSLVTPIASIGISILSTWVENMELDKKIEEKVDKAISEKEES